MKVYIGPYPMSPITSFALFKSYMKWAYPNQNFWDIDEKNYTKRDVFVDKTLGFLDTVVLWPLNFVMKRVRTERKIKVRIDNHDTWNADNTLAHIIHPMLVALEKHGTPWTDREDAPSDAKYDNRKDAEEYEVGYNSDRWEYILGEMTFAFAMIKDGEWDFKIYEKHGDNWTDEAFEERRQIQERINNGLRLFGKYYQNLWT